MEKEKKTLNAGPVDINFYRAVRKVAFERDLTVARFIKVLLREELKKNGVNLSPTKEKEPA